jgi:hypothetical protein
MTLVVPKSQSNQCWALAPAKLVGGGKMRQGMTLVVPIKPIESFGLYWLRKNSLESRFFKAL